MTSFSEDSLVVHLPLNQNEEIPDDIESINLSDSNRSGIIFGSPSYSFDRNGEANSSVYFNGNNYLFIDSFDSSIKFEKGITVSFWAKFDEKTNNNAPIFWLGAFEGSLHPSVNPVSTSIYSLGNKIRFSCYTSDAVVNSASDTFVRAVSKIDYTDTNPDWNLYSFSMDTSRKVLSTFKNGLLVRSEYTQSSKDIVSSEALEVMFLGTNEKIESSNGNKKRFIGYLDDFKIYNKSFSESDFLVSNKLNLTPPKFPQCLEHEKKIKELEEKVSDLNKEVENLNSKLKEANGSRDYFYTRNQALVLEINNILNERSSTFINGWIYIPEKGWAYTNNEIYPLIYMNETESWVLYKEGTHSPRLFYSYLLNEWEAWDEIDDE